MLSCWVFYSELCWRRRDIKQHVGEPQTATDGQWAKRSGSGAGKHWDLWSQWSWQDSKAPQWLHFQLGTWLWVQKPTTLSSFLCSGRPLLSFQPYRRLDGPDCTALAVCRWSSNTIQVLSHNTALISLLFLSAGKNDCAAPVIVFNSGWRHICPPRALSNPEAFLATWLVVHVYTGSQLVMGKPTKCFHFAC